MASPVQRFRVRFLGHDAATGETVGIDGLVVGEPEGESDPLTVARETGDVLMAALEESDAPGEVLHDVAEDAATDAEEGLLRRKRVVAGAIGGLVLLVVATLVRRRGDRVE